MLAALMFREGASSRRSRCHDLQKNDRIPQFVIDHQAPDKTDDVFNLELAGKEPNTALGTHALTTLQDPQVGHH